MTQNENTDISIKMAALFVKLQNWRLSNCVTFEDVQLWNNDSDFIGSEILIFR